MEGNANKISMEDMIYDITNNKTGAMKTMGRVYKIVYEQENNIKNEIYQVGNLQSGFNISLLMQNVISNHNKTRSQLTNKEARQSIYQTYAIEHEGKVVAIDFSNITYAARHAFVLLPTNLESQQKYYTTSIIFGRWSGEQHGRQDGQERLKQRNQRW